MVGPVGEGVNLDEQFGGLHVRQTAKEPVVLGAQMRVEVVCAHWAQVQPAVRVEPYVGVGLVELGFQFVEVAFQLGLQICQAISEAGRGPGACQGVGADVRPPLGWDQVGGGVGVSARSLHPDLAGAQGALQDEQESQFPVVPVVGGLAGGAGGV